MDNSRRIINGLQLSTCKIELPKSSIELPKKESLSHVFYLDKNANPAILNKILHYTSQRLDVFIIDSEKRSQQELFNRKNLTSGQSKQITLLSRPHHQPKKYSIQGYKARTKPITDNFSAQLNRVLEASKKPIALHFLSNQNSNKIKKSALNFNQRTGQHLIVVFNAVDKYKPVRQDNYSMTPTPKPKTSRSSANPKKWRYALGSKSADSSPSHNAQTWKNGVSGTSWTSFHLDKSPQRQGAVAQITSEKPKGGNARPPTRKTI